MKFALVGGQAKSVIRFRLDLLKDIKARGYEVVVFATNQDDPDLEIKLEAQGIKWENLDIHRASLNPIRDLKLLWDLYIKFRRHRPDVLLCYHIKPVIYGTFAAFLAGVPKRFALISGLGFTFVREGFRGKVLKGIASTLYRYALHFSELVFMQNPDDRKVFVDAHIVPENKVALIAGSGVNLKNYSPRTQIPETLTFILVARILRDKGVIEFIQAAKKFLGLYPLRAKFLLVGPLDFNPESLAEREVVELFENAGVDYLGESFNVPELLHKSSVFVLPSYREGTPRSVLEAMACGLAIITTDAPGCRETIVDGEQGFLVPVRSAQEVFVAMEKFYLRPQLVESMGHSALQRVRQVYDVRLVNQVIMKKMGVL